MKTQLFLFATIAAFIFVIAACPNPKIGKSTDCGCTEQFPMQADTPLCTAFANGHCGFCADRTCDTGGSLCSYLPRDVDFMVGAPGKPKAGYSTFIPTCQKPFDWFSWQTFVALNWPSDSVGNPLPVQIGQTPNAPRVWESYSTLDEVFNPGSKRNSGLLRLGQITKAGPHVFPGNIANLEAGSNKPLIDRNLNFALYEVRVNPEEMKYIQSQGLTTYCGQKAFFEKGNRDVNFPSGNYPKNEIGAIEIKTAWRVLVPGTDNFGRYFTRIAIIEVPASAVVGNMPILDTVTVGLVGMHIIRKVSSQGSEWIWSSFEHIGNAPDCPDGKCPPNPGQWSFFNSACSSCPLNTPPATNDPASNPYLWSPKQASGNPQYARRYAQAGRYGTQAARINPIEISTQAISAQWQQKLKGTVWENYRLIGSQWLDEEGSRGPSLTIGIPEKQANNVLETYLQKIDTKTGSGSCMNCHGGATATYSQLYSNLSFVLSYPAPDSSGCSGK
jgi:hypothetical protein